MRTQLQSWWVSRAATDARAPGVRRMLGNLAYAAGFVAVLGVFGILDVYHNRFFHSGHGRAYIAYNLSRVLFLAYAVGGLCAVGRWTLRRVAGGEAAGRLRAIDEVLLTFFAGAAVMAAGLFVLGFLNLYYYWVLAPLAVLLVAWSWAEVSELGGRVWVDHLRPAAYDRNPVRFRLRLAVVGCVALLSLALLVVKGLYPGGGGDYYTHYFPYYVHAVASHGLWPNDVWYHFYVSKGAVLVIAGIAITDPVIPEVLTYGFFMASAGCLYSLIRRYINSPFVPLAAVAGYIGAFVWTETPGQIAEWGLFQKHHEFTAALIISVAWAAVSFDDRGPAGRRLWGWAVGLFAGHAVLFAPTCFPLVAGILGLTAATAALHRRWALARGLAVGIGVAGAVLAGTLALNYAVTGMAEISPFRPFWRFADQERFSRSVSPYMMVLLGEGSAAGMGEIQVMKPEQMTRWEYIRQLVRWHAAAPYLPPGAAAAGCVALLVAGVLAVRVSRRRAPGPEVWRVAVPVLGALTVAVVLSQFVTQPTSVYRYFSFTTFFSVAAAVGLWVMVFRAIPYRRLVGLTSYALPAVVTGWVTISTLTDIPEDEVRNTVRFAAGRISMAHAYATRQSAVQMPTVEARWAVGDPTARVYTFNQNNYSMAPGCEVESFVSFAFRRDWHTVMFESPEVAREALRAQGLNYFLIDFNAVVIDVIPYAPLFRPENIGKYLRVAWSQGDIFLLTWRDTDAPGAGGADPLPCEFICRYDESYFTQWVDFRPLYEQVRTIYEGNRGRAYPVYRDPALPPVRGWQ